MSVEYIPFDPTLIGKEEIIIWCPDEANHPKLTELLEAHGVVWIGSETRPSDGWEWQEYCEQTAVRVRVNRHMSISPIDWYESHCRKMVFMKFSLSLA